MEMVKKYIFNLNLFVNIFYNHINNYFKFFYSNSSFFLYIF